MKIFLSFLQSKVSHPIAAYSFWEHYIKNGIEEAGYTWLACDDVDWAYGLVPQSDESLKKWKTESWERTIDYLKKNKVDVFLSYLYPHQIDESAIALLRSNGIYCINFFCDNIRNFKKAPKEFGSFDLNWVPEYEAMEMYKKASFAAINLPMPMWVAQEYRTIPATENDRISFIGSKDIQRQLLFNAFIEKYPKTNIDIYGHGWIGTEEHKAPSFSISQKINNQIRFLYQHGIKAYLNKFEQRSLKLKDSPFLAQHLKGKPSFNDYIKLSRESAITIGVNRYPSFNYPLHKPNSYSRLRDIEAPMLGACYLTEHTEGITELYDINTEILTYRTIDELNEKSELLLKDKELRLSLRHNGQKRALSAHSIPASLKRLLK